MQTSSTAKPPTVHASYVQAPPEQRVSRQRPAPLRLSLIGMATLLFLALALLAWYEIGHSQRIFKGVSVLGSDLSGMSRDEAAAAIAVAASGYPADAVAVTDSGHSWSFPASALGVGVDAEKTLDAAMAIGRSGSLLDNLGTQMGAFFRGATTSPALKQDSAAIDKVVGQIAGDIDKTAVDSRLEKDANGVVQITASSEGTSVDRPALSNALSAAVAHVPFSAVNVAVVPVAPRVTEADLQSTRTQALLLTEQQVVLKAGDLSWTINPTNLREFLTINRGGNGTVTAALDNNLLAAYLQPVAGKLRVEPESASVVVADGTVTLNKDVPGQELDVPAAITAIQLAAEGSTGDTRVVTLPTKVIPAVVHTQDVQALYDKANGLVNQGVRLHYADDGYIMRGSAVTGFIDVKPAQGGPGPLELVIDNSVLADRVAGVAYYINKRPSDARFKLVNGVPTKVAEASVGVNINIDKSVENATKAITGYAGGDRLQIELDATVTQPSVQETALTGINTPNLLAYGQTSYANSSANRAWNVEFGTSKIDGTLIPPGGIFSTVDTIGDLTLQAGFKMGYGIVSDGTGGVTTVPAEAGGICQVSTTLFHAVFRAGLHVTERNWHSYWIGIYGIAPTGLQGLDATISPPDKDFRFQNNTGNWVLIKASASKGTVKFELYGVNPHWNISIGQPVITNVVKTTQDPITEYSDQVSKSVGKVMVEHAQDGFTASISRVVTDSSGKVVDNWTAKSTYLPAHNRYLIGTGN